MVNFQTGKLVLDYPIYGSKFLDENILLVTGGGGEGNNGVPNKITAVTIDFNRTKIIKRFRELPLAEDEDAPTCLDANNNVIILSCNQGTELIKSGVNNHLRKYGFINNHLRFLQEAQISDSNDPTEYMKSVSVSEDGSVACLSSSQNGDIFIIDTETLEIKFNIDTKTTIKDLCISSDGKILAYLTQSSLEFISTVTGNQIASQTFPDLSVSKVKFINNNSVIVAASLKKSQGLVLLEYSLDKKATTRRKIINKKTRGVTAMSCQSGLIALGGNDTSIILIKSSNFALVKQFPKVHSFAITTVQISPNGDYLASTSADNSINVFKLPQNLATSSSFFISILTKIFTFLLVILLGVVVQWLIKKRVINDLVDYYKRELDSSDYFTIQPLGRKSSQTFESNSAETSTQFSSSTLEFSNHYSSSLSEPSIFTSFTASADETTTTAIEEEEAVEIPSSKEAVSSTILTTSSTAFSDETESHQETETETLVVTNTVVTTESVVHSTTVPVSSTVSSSAPASSNSSITKKIKKTKKLKTAEKKTTKSPITLKSLSSSTLVVESSLLTVSPSTEVITPGPSTVTSESISESPISSIVEKIAEEAKSIESTISSLFENVASEETLSTEISSSIITTPSVVIDDVKESIIEPEVSEVTPLQDSITSIIDEVVSATSDPIEVISITSTITETLQTITKTVKLQDKKTSEQVELDFDESTLESAISLEPPTRSVELDVESSTTIEQDIEEQSDVGEVNPEAETVDGAAVTEKEHRDEKDEVEEEEEEEVEEDEVAEIEEQEVGEEEDEIDGEEEEEEEEEVEELLSSNSEQEKFAVKDEL